MTGCWRKGSITDSFLRTVMGVANEYSKSSPASRPSAVAATELYCGTATDSSSIKFGFGAAGGGGGAALLAMTIGRPLSEALSAATPPA